MPGASADTPSKPRFDFSWTENLPWLCDTLLAAARILDRPRWHSFNETVRRFWSGPGLWALQRLAPAPARGPMQWKARHSVLSPGAFNAALSDIDLAVCFAFTPNAQELDTLSRFYRRIRRVVPVLGEMEVYSRSEWILRTRIESKPAMAALISFLWNVRKMGWLEKKLSIPTHPYHAYKLERALRRCWEKLGEPPVEKPRRSQLSSASANQLREILMELGVYGESDGAYAQYYCDYLLCVVGSEWMLPPATAQSLLSILPPAQSLPADFQKAIDQRRTRHTVGQTRQMLMLHEWVCVRSRQRTHPAEAPGHQYWIDRLRGELRRGFALDWSHPAG